jgi:hypothetical protein
MGACTSIEMSRAEAVERVIAHRLDWVKPVITQEVN